MKRDRFYFAKWAFSLFFVAVSARPLWAAAFLAGDCNVDDRVTVEEIVTLVRLALGEDNASACPAADTNQDGAVTIEEIVAAVQTLLAAPPLPQVAFVTATDFQTGSFALVGEQPPFPVEPTNPQRRLGADPVARVFGRRVYVVNRFGGDNVQVLDAADHFRTLLQCSTGNGSNPQDIAFRSGLQAYIPLLARAWLLRVNPHPAADCHDFIVGRIDLQQFADVDGSPEANQATVVGDKLFVTLERLENFAPVRNGLLLVVDTNTDEVVASMELAAANPFGMTKGLTVRNGRLFVALVGAFGALDGGIEAIDTATLVSDGLVITEAELGGDVTDFVLADDEYGYAVISGPDFSTSLVRFDLKSRSVVTVLSPRDGLSDLELSPRGLLFLTDRNLHRPGVRVLRATDGAELTPAPLFTGLPPFDLVFLP
ncbi:MAG: hypothetical protein KatS3mg077_1863 [Candidatus Binatia bacterium]|nr:MAG: hypothetical protein KatS3mg077_1863 [Candidatus Binatia bacterium]